MRWCTVPCFFLINIHVPTTTYLLFTRYSRYRFAPWVSITLLIWISQVDQEWVSYGLINPSKLEGYYWDVYGFMGFIMICFATLTQMAWSYTIWDNMNFHTVATPFRLTALDPEWWPNENMSFATSYPPRKRFLGCSRYRFADSRTASQKVCHGIQHGPWPLRRGAGHSADRRGRWNWMKCIASNQCVRKLRRHKIASFGGTHMVNHQIWEYPILRQFQKVAVVYPA